MHRSKTPAADDDSDVTESNLVYADLDFAEFQAARWVVRDVIALSPSSSSFICLKTTKRDTKNSTNEQKGRRVRQQQ